MSAPWRDPPDADEIAEIDAREEAERVQEREGAAMDFDDWLGLGDEYRKREKEDPPRRDDWLSCEFALEFAIDALTELRDEHLPNIDPAPNAARLDAMRTRCQQAGLILGACLVKVEQLMIQADEEAMS